MAKIELNGEEYEGKEIIVKDGKIIIDGYTFLMPELKGYIYGEVIVIIIEGKEKVENGVLTVI